MSKATAKPKQPATAVPAGRNQLIDIKSMRFDPENPRTVERLGRDASQNQVEEFLLGGEMKARDLVPSKRQFANEVAGLSRIIRQGNPQASRFEKRAFRAVQKLIGGWGVCVGSPREAQGWGAERTIRHYRSLLFDYEKAGQWPTDFSPNGDNGADGFLILGRGWGGPIAFYQSKNTGFDLESHPEEFSRIPSIAEDWFGKKINAVRQIIPLLALNTVLTIDLKEKIYAERGAHGVHVVDAVDILATEHLSNGHEALRCNCLVL